MSNPPSSNAASQPRFRQILDVLRQQIQEGGLPEHAALPSERIIAQEHDVSRMTARRALEALEMEGLAYSEHRRGRFVSPARLTYDITRMISFAADAKSDGISLDIELVNATSCQTDAKLSPLLEVAIGEKLFRYTRLFYINCHAIFIETEHVLASRCPGLLDHDLRQSTTLLLEQHYKISAHVGDITIRMRGFADYEADHLGLPPNQSGIELEQVIRDAHGKPFCVGQQIWRGELAEFSARAIVNPKNAG